MGAGYTDYWGKTFDIKNKRIFLFDMDGTLYSEGIVFRGTRELLELLDGTGRHYMFITNNSSRSVKDYVRTIQKLGIKATEDNFFTSTQATILYLASNYNGKKVYCQGTVSFLDELESAGVIVTDNVESDVDVCLVGFDTELTSKKLRNTCEVLQKEVTFIATNPDKRCPVSFGFIPDCGSICEMLTNATGKVPKFIGKPEPTMLNTLIERYKFSKDDCIAIGDRLYTDIAAGINSGISTICVLTGEATPNDINNSSIKPTYTVFSTYEIFESLCD
jgi:HAD superfamily hydrolase (TIGR01450 family)